MSDESSPAAAGITAGRARSLITGLVGLISLIIGWLAKARFVGSARRFWAISSLVLGTACIILSVAHLSTVTSGFGTGSGKAGAIVALALGITGMVFAGLALRPKKEYS